MRWELSLICPNASQGLLKALTANMTSADERILKLCKYRMDSNIAETLTFLLYEQRKEAALIKGGKAWHHMKKKIFIIFSLSIKHRNVNDLTVRLGGCYPPYPTQVQVQDLCLIPMKVRRHACWLRVT
jgi:hypothetical protein